ncbi:uncharacterized protein J3R85_008449 [Psidium guajava]|nr:uncharacterized protein J3R85_008449 [Psidium guajava]
MAPKLSDSVESVAGGHPLKQATTVSSLALAGNAESSVPGAPEKERGAPRRGLPRLDRILTALVRSVFN